MLAEDFGGASGAEGCESGCAELPKRPASDRPRVYRIRCMDDPEILERVLEGLLNLT